MSDCWTSRPVQGQEGALKYVSSDICSPSGDTAGAARSYYRLGPQQSVVPVSRTYRCLNCLEDTVTRSYDVSHLTRRCGACDEFDRHVNQRVLDQYDAFEADPPDALDWESLDRTRKLLVAERVARHGRSVESFAPDPDEADDVAGDAESALSEDDADAPDGRSPDVTAGGEVAPTNEAADDDPEDEPVVDPDSDADVATGTTDEPDPPDSTPSGD